MIASHSAGGSGIPGPGRAIADSGVGCAQAAMLPLVQGNDVARRLLRGEACP